MSEFSDYNYDLIKEESKSNEMDLLQQREDTYLSKIIENNIFDNGLDLNNVTYVHDDNSITAGSSNGFDGLGFADSNYNNAGNNNNDNIMYSRITMKYTPTSNGPEDDISMIEDKEIKKQKNRDAQKAFRNRKEAKIKELEIKLQNSEQSKTSLINEIAALKAMNEKLILHSDYLKSDSSNATTLTTAQGFSSKTNFIEHITTKHNEKLRFDSPESTDTLSIPETWEYLQKKKEDLDFNMVYIMEHLKGNEICHNYGPGYAKEMVDKLIQSALNSI
ncbi:hypothetical protein TPHA_0G03310 [Tetrapisispora phaffii CBS 4417]|uniref:BZIP domain-containing protein n=1 Tax=Tetrapisispora phaffii (strain ATCC 24235 / CBS 4417 / NBRC 1672 / NRRL Y-8282 / UCD 70-5) TaxID=1071381 RepID=G8BW93_TETPH|nr:hypothetical protein TPHA_0G03310 [Tetrapisispora phaffii CBS 4417]CCE64171.1 hypothetical protein TPHA_0G03310 [Tetrapisispora phaffii CBS 4417]